jgi:predicted ATP-dependent endonuclease of OLD family
MKLVTVRVEMFDNIVDSTEVSIERDVTCMVGKNESGKTAFLKALARLNPAREAGSKFIPRDDYPRWRWRRDEKEGRVNKARPVWATFELEDADVAAVEKEYGSGALTSRTLTAWRTYANDLMLEVQVDEGAVVQHLTNQLLDGSPVRKGAAKAKTFAQLQAAIEKAKAPVLGPDGTTVSPPGQAEATAVEARMQQLAGTDVGGRVAEPLRARLPKFFYFGQYSFLPGRIALGRLLSTKPGELEEEEVTALALLKLAGGTNENLTAEDYEQRVAELEASGNEITRQVLDYWETNQEIRVSFDIDKKIEKDANGVQRIVERYLDIRLHDERHQFTTNFKTRSTGFRWLFSFIAAFSAFEDLPEGVVVLLDEPALNLHARAQADFLRFINERIATRHQVIYTTHSPFMVEADGLRRVRLVEDKTEGDGGSTITRDVLSTDRDTLFPLQAALGYDLSQNLFVGANSLVIEGTSDFIYISAISRHLERLGRSHLDLRRWTLTPVGGASGIPTFVALLGSRLNVTVLVDADAKVNQRLTDLVVKGLLQSQRLVTVGQAIGKTRADIEDLFTPDEYVTLHNKAFGTAVKVPDLPPGDGPIVKRLEQRVGAFDHGRPAEVMLRDPDVVKTLSEETLKRFEKLFELVNATMPGAAPVASVVSADARPASEPAVVAE